MTSVGAEGLDLQFCSVLINYDLTWNPMVLEQRIGRIDRIGQRKEEIHIYNIIVSGSIDERIITTLGRKLGLVEGSVLETATVLGSAQKGGRLFSVENIAEERTAATKLAKALELSSSLNPSDYEVIRSIDTQYCELLRLGDQSTISGNAPWILESQTTLSWLKELHDQHSRLDAAIELYAS